MFFLFFIAVYLGFLYFFINGQYSCYLALLVLLILFCIFQAKYRSIYFMILLAGFLFLVMGEAYFRSSYFGPDALVRCREYVPTYLADPLCLIERDDRTFTGLKPLSSGIFKGKSFYVNNLGFRDKNRYFKKPGGTFRIMLLGASFSMGWGVNQKENYGACLEEMLNNDPGLLRKFSRFEVINLSKGGYGVDDLIRALQIFGPKFEPDMIFVSYERWEVKGLHKNKEFRRSKWDLIKMAIKRPYAVSFFFNAIKQEFIKGLELNAENIFKISGRAAGTNAANDQNGDPKAYFNAFKRYSNNTPLFIIALRPMRDMDEHLIFDPSIKGLCKGYGFGVIDTYDEDYGTNVRNMIIYPGDHHPNAMTHKIYARSIFRQIRPAISAYGRN